MSADTYINEEGKVVTLKGLSLGFGDMSNHVEALQTIIDARVKSCEPSHEEMGMLIVFKASLDAISKQIWAWTPNYEYYDVGDGQKGNGGVA